MNACELKFKKLPEILRGHDLLDLAHRVKFQPTFEEEELLRRLDRSSTWAGRYPCPLRPEDMIMEEFSDGTYRFIDFLSVHDSKGLFRLRERIMEHVQMPP